MYLLFLQQQANTTLVGVLGKYLPYIKNLVIPTILLCIYSLLKYMIAIGWKNVTWVELFIELPIDFLCVASTLIITNYIFLGGIEVAIILGVVLLLISIFFAVVSCYLRRYIIDCCRSRMNNGHPIIAGLSLYFIVFGWVFFVLYFSYSLNNNG